MTVELKRAKGLGEVLRLWRLYREAFPAAERKPFSILLNMAKEGRGDFWVLQTQGRFAGMAFVIRGRGLVLLDYFAVTKSRRGTGVGTGALAALLEQYREEGFFLEIESTREASANAGQRVRRKRFYLSCGLEELGAEAVLFGVRMELLGTRCTMNYEQYRDFYRENLGQWAADHVQPVCQ